MDTLIPVEIWQKYILWRLIRISSGIPGRKCNTEDLVHKKMLYNHEYILKVNRFLSMRLVSRHMKYIIDGMDHIWKKLYYERAYMLQLSSLKPYHRSYKPLEDIKHGELYREVIRVAKSKNYSYVITKEKEVNRMIGRYIRERESLRKQMGDIQQELRQLYMQRSEIRAKKKTFHF